MVNFVIVESNVYHEHYDEFCAMHNGGVPVKQIREQLGLSKANFNTYYKRAIEEGRITKRHRRHDKKPEKYLPKNYTRMDNGYFRITKNNKYVSCIFGEERAKLFVELMRECDWDKTRIDEFKRHVYTIYPTRKRVFIDGGMRRIA